MPEGYEWLIGELRIFIFCFIKPVQERGKRREKPGCNEPGCKKHTEHNSYAATYSPSYLLLRQRFEGSC